MLASVLPSAATIPIAKTKRGKAMIVSTIRPMMRSVQPPKYPATRPSRVPIAKASATEVTAMPRSSRVATMIRLKMSRPSWSVPKRWAEDGPVSARAVSLESGS
jgi:hypothetical protein